MLSRRDIETTIATCRNENSFIGEHEWLHVEVVVIMHHEGDVAQSVVFALARSTEISNAKTTVGGLLRLRLPVLCAYIACGFGKVVVILFADRDEM